MTAKSLRKVKKRITKKKGVSPALHVDSRDSQRLRRATAREDKLFALAAEKAKQSQPFLERVAFFQACAAELEDQSQTPSPSTTHETIQRYLNRHDEELNQLKASRRPGRPTSTRQDVLAQRQDREQKEYTSGLWMPDLDDADNVAVLLAWDGDWAALNTVKFCRVLPNGQKREAKFPPNHDY